MLYLHSRAGSRSCIRFSWLCTQLLFSPCPEDRQALACDWQKASAESTGDAAVAACVGTFARTRYVLQRRNIVVFFRLVLIGMQRPYMAYRTSPSLEKQSLKLQNRYQATLKYAAAKLHYQRNWLVPLEQLEVILRSDRTESHHGLDDPASCCPLGASANSGCN